MARLIAPFVSEVQVLDKGEELQVSGEAADRGLTRGPHRTCRPAVLTFENVNDYLHSD
jgi:hypothetical protein